jgi:hypothetical protein
VAERCPFVLSTIDIVFSHHAAIDLATSLRIERAGRVGQPATDLEVEFREIRRIMHCRRELAFYLVQRLTLEREARKRVLAQVDARKTLQCEVVRCERRFVPVGCHVCSWRISGLKYLPSSCVQF